MSAEVGPRIWHDEVKEWVPIRSQTFAAPRGCSDGEPEATVQFDFSVDGKDIRCRKVLAVSSFCLRDLPLPTGSWEWSPSDSDDLIRVHIDLEDIAGLTFAIKSVALACGFRGKNVHGKNITLLQRGDMLLSIDGTEMESLTEQEINDIWSEATLEKKRYVELLFQRQKMAENDRWLMATLNLGMAENDLNTFFGFCSLNRRNEVMVNGDALKAVLDELSINRKKALANTLGILAGERTASAISILSYVLLDTDQGVRLCVIEALKRLGRHDPSVKQPLTAASYNGDEITRSLANKALSDLGIERKRIDPDAHLQRGRREAAYRS